MEFYGFPPVSAIPTSSLIETEKLFVPDSFSVTETVDGSSEISEISGLGWEPIPTKYAATPTTITPIIIPIIGALFMKLIKQTYL